MDLKLHFGKGYLSLDQIVCITIVYKYILILNALVHNV